MKKKILEPFNTNLVSRIIHPTSSYVKCALSSLTKWLRK